VQQTLYWTKSGTLACGECGAEVSHGDGKVAPYVIEHARDCESCPDSTLRCAV
jgi:hypothetical protein